jgi:TolB-like protein/class 3 adenylate cyclase
LTAREHRRLAAIVVADVVGYSRLMGRDESGTLARLREHRTQRLEPTRARHGGRLVKLTGDGALVEFGSAVDALTAAIEFQQAMAEANREQPEDSRIVFRMGLHLGDLIVEGDDLYGEGVNVAARLEAEAPPGGILVSRAVREAVDGRLKAKLHALGELSLKNIERPIRAFRVEWEAADWKATAAPALKALQDEPTTIAPAALALALPDKPSIAVLPFQNMSGDPEQEYFADGMVEDIITALSRFKSLFVIARNSSFTYKGRAVDIKQVGRELGVRYVLEGSVRKAGGRVRITGQLIDSETGAHLWADRFDGVLDELFELQDRVTASVAGAVAPALGKAELEGVHRGPTRNDAYDCYLRGLILHYGTRTRLSVETAMALFYRAIELDADFATPYGLAAFDLSICKSEGWITDAQQAEAEVRRLAAAVARIGQDDAIALSGVGHALGWLCRDLDAAAALIDRALLVNPNLSAAWSERAMISLGLGHHEKAIEQASRAIRLSPVDIRRWHPEMMLAYAHLMLGKKEEGLSWAKRALAARPDNMPLLLAAAAAHGHLGHTVEADIAIAALRQRNPAISLTMMPGYHIFKRAEDKETFMSGLRLAGMPE